MSFTSILCEGIYMTHLNRHLINNILLCCRIESPQNQNLTRRIHAGVKGLYSAIDSGVIKGLYRF